MREESRIHMEVDAGKEDTEEADTLLKEAKHNGTTKTWSLKEKIIDAKKKAVLKMLDPPWALPPKVEVGEDEIKSTPMKLQEEFKRVVRTAMKVDKRTPMDKDEAKGGALATDKGG